MRPAAAGVVTICSVLTMAIAFVMLCAKGVMWATMEEARIPQAITGRTIAIASYIGITLPDLCIAMIMGALLDKHADNVGQAYSIFFLILQGLCVVGAIACIRPRAKPYENSTLDFQFYDSAHEIGCQDSSTEKLAMPASGTVCIDYRILQKIGLPKCKTEQRSFQNMKATGIVRRIDDLGRVVIPKEIRRTMRIREGDPLEIYTDTDGQVIFKKYSPMGELSEFAAQICDALHKTTGGIAAVCDRDAVIAVAGGGKRELLDRRISRELEELMSTRGQYAADSCTLPVVDTDERYAVAVAAPILSEGDVLGCVLFVAGHGDGPAGETERKLAQAVSGFLGKQMES